MNVLSSIDDYYNEMFKLIDNTPDRIFISTFGIYAGIPDTGYADIPKTREILDRIQSNNIKTSILVGYSDYFSCNGRSSICTSCEIKYIKSMMRLMQHANHYTQFSWKMTTKLHLKCNIFIKDSVIKCITGGRNFTNSDWCDVSLLIDNSIDNTKILQQYINGNSKATMINEQNILTVLEEQGISKKSFAATMDGI